MRTKLHPSFEFELWQKRLKTSHDNTGSLKEIDGELFSQSPAGIVIAEHYRRLAIENGANLGPSVPTDVCVFGRGEPPQRYLTKVNGLPYRPRSRPWPLDSNGERMTFLCQFCFCDSHDHVGQLPGDVLLIFVKTFKVGDTSEYFPVSPARPDAFQFEWYQLGLEDLTAVTEPAAFIFPQCYVVQHRSCDFMDQTQAIDAVSTIVPEDVLPKQAIGKTAVLRALTCWPGMKLGGAPYWNRLPPPPSTGMFLGGFSGVGWVHLREHPHITVSEELGLEESLANSNYFQFSGTL